MVREYFFVVSSCKDLTEAKRIADSVLEKKLAACANVLPIVYSSYWWQGKLEKTTEVLLVLKTKSLAVEKLKIEILKLHSYKNPEFVVIPISLNSNAKFLDWIEDSVKA